METKKNRKRTVLNVIMVIIVLILAGILVGILYEKEEQPHIVISDGDDALDNVVISAEQCEEFFNRRQETLEYLVEEIKKQDPDHSYKIVFNNEGTLKLDKDLKVDENFIKALEELYTDEIFQLNPYFWFVAEQENNQWIIEFRLFTYAIGYGGSYGGMIYHEAPKEEYYDVIQKKLNDNWYWFSYPTL